MSLTDQRQARCSSRSSRIQTRAYRTISGQGEPPRSRKCQTEQKGNHPLTNPSFFIPRTPHRRPKRPIRESQPFSSCHRETAIYLRPSAQEYSSRKLFQSLGPIQVGYMDRNLREKSGTLETGSEAGRHGLGMVDCTGYRS